MVPTPLRKIDLKKPPEDFEGEIAEIWWEMYNSLRQDYTWIPDGVAVRPSSMREMAYRAAEQALRRYIRYRVSKGEIA